MRGTRTRITTGVYKDRAGVSIIVSVNGLPREFREDEQGRKYTTAWSTDQFRRERIRVAAREQAIHERRVAHASTLAADVDTYVHTLHGRAREDAEDQLGHWLAAFADRDRRTLTAVELRQHAATWTCAASTFNHRRQALISLYRTLDGPDAANPAREIPKRPESFGAPRALSYTVIADVFKKMPVSDSKARLMLMAYTGLPQMQIQKLAPDDWQGARLRVTPRRKGAGASGRWIPLSPDAQQAMTLFADRQCWGNFSRSSLWKAWSRYAPTGTNPYSLRHSWITELYRRSNGDMLALQQLSLHARLDQTQRYAAAALEDRMAALVVPRKRSTRRASKRSKRLQKTPAKRKR